MIPKDAIEILKGIQDNLEETKFLERCALDMAIEALKDRPHGEWIFKNGKYRCTACGDKAIYRYNGTSTIPKEILTDFCPNCGAVMDMRGEAE